MAWTIAQSGASKALTGFISPGRCRSRTPSRERLRPVGDSRRDRNRHGIADVHGKGAPQSRRRSSKRSWTRR